METKGKKFFIFFAAIQLVILLTACEAGNGNKGNEMKGITDLENKRYVANILEDMQKVVWQKAEVMWKNAEDLEGWLTRLAMDLPKEREHIRVIYPVEWCELGNSESYFPEGVIQEIVDAFEENSLMEFMDSHMAEYQILSRDEIEKYADSSDTVYNFIEEMEWRNSHTLVDDENKYKKREEKIREISETDAIWYMLPLDYSDTVVVYGKYATYKFDLRGFGLGFMLTTSADELYFISWGEDNLIIGTEEDLESIRVFYFDDVTIGNIAVIEKNGDGKPNVSYYGYLG